MTNSEAPPVIVRRIRTIRSPSHNGIRLKKRITKISFSASRQLGEDAAVKSAIMGIRGLFQRELSPPLLKTKISERL